MAKTVAGLFKNSDVAEGVVRNIESKGFPRMAVRALHEPVDGPSALMSTPRADFEAQVARELMGMGASNHEAQAYAKGLRGGGVLVLATDSDEKAVDAAAGIMNQHGAVGVEEASDPGLKSRRGAAVPAVRARQGLGGVRCFVWCVLVDLPVGALSK